MHRVDYDQIAPRYELGRVLVSETARAWRDAVTPFVTSSEDQPVLDVGAGTGMWTKELGEWFDTWAVALEPSSSMRRVGSRRDRRIRWVAGVAERIPLGTACAGAAWLSTVIHHLRDLGACARELRRVLRPGAPVLIRGSFPGRLDHIPMFTYFPGARRFVEEFPTVEVTVETFAHAGFSFEHLRGVHEVAARSLDEYLRQARSRSDSTLVRLADEEFRRGLSALERAAREERRPAPVTDRVDLLVLR